jgi:predicted metalloprotease with PDZ domain
VTPANAISTKDFTIGKTHLRAVFFDHPDAITNADEIVATLKSMVSAEGQIMHGLPTTQYKFLFDVNGPGGGLEHLNCTRIALPAGIPPPFLAPFAGHEAFHMWNVKRIRPFVLGPFDYIHPPVTRNLWFAEGVTEYYAYVASRRAGIMNEQQFLNHWKMVTRSFGRNPQRLKVSADDSSRRVWEAGNSSGYGISYYTKGELIGLCLDLKIRHVTQNRKSLDDVMRLLMSRNGLPKPGYGEDDIRNAVNEVAGTDLGAFYDLLARSTEEMPFAECLSYAGLTATCDPIADASADALALRKSWTAAFQPEVK